MKSLFGLPLLMLIVLTFARVSSADVSPGVMGFQAWKTSRIESARTILERLQQDSQLEKAPQVDRVPERATLGKSALRVQKSPRVDQKIQQAQFNVQIAQEHTVNDYFLLYLSQFKLKDAFIEAARKMTPEETAELMIAYQKNLTASEPVDIAPPSVTLNSNQATTNKSVHGF